MRLVDCVSQLDDRLEGKVCDAAGLDELIDFRELQRESTVKQLTLLGRFESVECPEWKKMKKRNHTNVLWPCLLFIFSPYIPQECVLVVSWPCGWPYLSNRCYRWFLPHVQFGDPPGMHPLCVSSLLSGCVSNWPPWMHCSVLDTLMWDFFFLFISKSPFKGYRVSFFLWFLVCAATDLWRDVAYLAPFVQFSSKKEKKMHAILYIWKNIKQKWMKRKIAGEDWDSFPRS